MSITTITNTLAEAEASLHDSLNMRSFAPRNERAFAQTESAHSLVHQAMTAFDLAEDARGYKAIGEAIAEVQAAITTEAIGLNTNTAAVGVLSEALIALARASVTR
jgi:hypothetical protein